MARYILAAMRAWIPSLGVLALAALLGGCAAAPTASSASCDLKTVMSLSPVSATADHSAAPPGNQQQFQAFGQEVPATADGSCAIPTVIALLTPAWTSSDPLDVTVTSGGAGNNGLATCVNSTSAPVTLTAVNGSGASALSGAVTLTCK